MIELGPCVYVGGTLCAIVVWDEGASPTRKPASCGVRIAQIPHFTDGAWRDDWAFDLCTGKHYKTELRAAGDKMTLRSYVGIELLGQTENSVASTSFQRVVR